MTTLPRKPTGFLLAVAATLGALGFLREFRARSLLDDYQTLAKTDYRAEGPDPERTVGLRISILEDVPRGTLAAPESSAAQALERVNAANARLLAGHAGPGDEDAVSDGLRRACGDVNAALRGNPMDTRTWLAGYRVIHAARLLGRAAICNGGSGGAPISPGVFLGGAVRTNPNSGELRHDLAALLVASADRPSALREYRNALQDPAVEGTVIAREMLDAGYDPSEIMDSMPPRFREQYGAAEVLLVAGSVELAERGFLAARRLSPATAEPLIALSRLYEAGGRHQEALESARSALPLLPGLSHELRSEVLACAAIASRSLGDVAAALSYGARALEENPGSLFFYNFMASLLYERRDFQGAIQYWQALLSTHPDDPYVKQHLALFHRSVGRSYLGLGDRERAMHCFLEALQADPQDEESRSSLQRLMAGA